MRSGDVISRHEVAFYQACDKRWRTAKELAELAGIAGRTARAFATKFTDLGILERAETWPAHQYRLAKLKATQNAYVGRLERAAAVHAQPD